ncbi:class I adenylate-forming enzyme family protein [Nocardioides limicola]|uniref:class I adenylate-forming enzyme family protein n=1 Tax=Nocardioides limicola TaxID=2803368 RepID=UPI00193C306F|nr:class I adenylate-forming enzyme family protein [Nocardioides sp. DJM-14]
MFYDWFGKSLAGTFDHTCREMPDHAALVVGARRLTYRELQDEVLEVAAGLQAVGVGAGTRVAAMVEGSEEFATMVLALHRLQAVLIPLNLSWTAREFVQSFQLTDPDLLITVEEFRGNEILAGLEGALPELTHSSFGDLQLADVPTLRGVITVRSSTPRPYARTFADVKAGGRGYDRTAMLALSDAVDPEAPVLCLPTSGSTGFPKPVMHSQNSFLSNCANYVDAVELTADDVVLNFGTTYHASGQLLFILPLIRGASQVLLDWFDPGVAMQLIQQEGVTVTWGFDVHFQMMARHPELKKYDISSLTRALIGSDPAAYDEIAQLGFEHHGNIYGCSEYLSNVFPYRDRADRERMRTSHGRPAEGVVQKIVDPATGDRVPVGQIGEICVKGPGLFKGYYKMPEQTAQAIDDEGFFHTGDFAYVDEAGYTYYRGRLKDTVKTGGENVSAREVELFLQTETPYVRMAQVFGVPDPKWGEAVTAMIELRDGVSITDQELRDFCRGKLAGYKIPKRFVIVGESDWIVTPTGKLDKQALRQRTLTELDSATTGA